MELLPSRFHPLYHQGFLNNYAATPLAPSTVDGISGSGVLATLRFNAITKDASDLIFSGVLLLDSTYTEP